MAERISRQMLDGKLRTLNDWIVGNPDPDHRTPHAFTIDKHAGGYQLEQYTPANRFGGIGVNSIGPRGSKREVMLYMDAMLTGIQIYRKSEELQLFIDLDRGLISDIRDSAGRGGTVTFYDYDTGGIDLKELHETDKGLCHRFCYPFGNAQEREL